MPEPQYRCEQAGTIAGMQQRLQNGEQNFHEFRNDIKKLLQDVAAMRANLNTISNCMGTVEELTKDVATLKEKARTWGATAGAIFGIIGGAVVKWIWK